MLDGTDPAPFLERYGAFLQSADTARVPPPSVPESGDSLNERHALRVALIYLHGSASDALLADRLRHLERAANEMIDLFDNQFRMNGLAVEGFRDRSRLALQLYRRLESSPYVHRVGFDETDPTRIVDLHTLTLSHTNPFGGFANNPHRMEHERGAFYRYAELDVGPYQLKNSPAFVDPELSASILSDAQVAREWPALIGAERVIVVPDLLIDSSDPGGLSGFFPTSDSVAPPVVLATLFRRPSGSAQRSTAELAKTFAHELGHSFGLSHLKIDEDTDANDPPIFGLEARAYDEAGEFGNVMMSPAVEGAARSFTVAQSRQLFSRLWGTPSTVMTVPALESELKLRVAGTEQFSDRELHGTGQLPPILTGSPFTRSVDLPSLPTLDPERFPLICAPLGGALSILCDDVARTTSSIAPPSTFRAYMPGRIDTRSGHLEGLPWGHQDIWQISPGVSQIEVGVIPMHQPFFMSAIDPSNLWTDSEKWAFATGAGISRAELPVSATGTSWLIVTHEARSGSKPAYLRIRVDSGSGACASGNCQLEHVHEDWRGPTPFALVLRADQTIPVRGSYYLAREP